MLTTRYLVVALLFSYASANLHAETCVAPKQRYSITNADRPFTLPPFMAEIDVIGKHTGLSQFAAKFSLSYGVIENFQFNFGYNGVKFELPFEVLEAENAFHLGFDYFLFESSFASTMLDFDFPLYAEADVAVAQNLELNLVTSIPIYRPARIGLTILHSGFINFFFYPLIGAEINLPVRLGWQATDAFWIGLGTNLAAFEINRIDSTGAYLSNEYFWTKTPIYLKALYGVTESFDFTGEIGFNDVQRDLGTNFYVSIGIGARFGRMLD